jgi:hypothetical protein
MPGQVIRDPALSESLCLESTPFGVEEVESADTVFNCTSAAEPEGMLSWC